MCIIEFEWDRAKAASNLIKHRLSFEAAALVFSDPFQIVEEDRIVEGESRWLAIGTIPGQRYITVVHTIRTEGEIDIIRIISARKADRNERKRYENQHQAEHGSLRN